MKTKSYALEMLWDSLIVLVGTAVYAVGLYYFVEPSNTAPGGVSGIALLVNYVTGFPVGIASALINAPLLILGLVFLGKEFILKTLLSVASFTVIYDYILTPLHFPYYEGERLMASLFGGIVTGVGLGLVFYAAGSTGGTDIITKLVQRRFPHMQLGRILLIVDLVIVSASIIVYRSIESALYAIIVIYANTQLINVVLYGNDSGRLFYILSDRYREITDAIFAAVDRGVTLLDGEGGYTGEAKKVILCAVRKNEYHKVKKLVRGIDPDAFIIAAESFEVEGEGFKAHKED